jgi:hypothetical protein
MDDGDGGRRIDAALVDMLWVEMANTYRTRRRRKRRSVLMRIVARALAWARVMPRERFLDRFATTVGRTIYLPDPVPGVRNLLWEAATCVHEHDHVRVWSLRFMWRYAMSPMWRALYEAQAYRTNIALRYWYAGDWLDIKDLAAKLGTNHGCGEAGVALAYRMFEAERAELRLGNITNPVVYQALQFLRQRGVRPDDIWPRVDL